MLSAAIKMRNGWAMAEFWSQNLSSGISWFAFKQRMKEWERKKKPISNVREENRKSKTAKQVVKGTKGEIAHKATRNCITMRLFCIASEYKKKAFSKSHALSLLPETWLLYKRVTYGNIHTQQELFSESTSFINVQNTWSTQGKGEKKISPSPSFNSRSLYADWAIQFVYIYCSCNCLRLLQDGKNQGCLTSWPWSKEMSGELSGRKLRFLHLCGV